MNLQVAVRVLTNHYRYYNNIEQHIFQSMNRPVSGYRTQKIDLIFTKQLRILEYFLFYLKIRVFSFCVRSTSVP
jgi:hypothetical protein